MNDGIHLYAVVARYDWATHRPVEVASVTAGKAEEIVREWTIPAGQYLSAVTGLSLSEAGRLEDWLLSQIAT